MMEENENVAPVVEPEKKSNSMLIAGIVAVLLVAGIGFMVISGRGADNTPTDTIADQSTDAMSGDQMTPAVEGAASSSGTEVVTTANGVTTVNLEAGSFYFKPNEIKVKKGDKVKIVMTSKDMVHNFHIDEFKVAMPMTKSGETNTVEFTADKVGTFEYYCSVGQHRKNGQVGKLIVE